MKTLTVEDIIKKLQTLPPKMEVWRTWDESGESFPITESAFVSDDLYPGWLIPTTVIKRRRCGKLRFEEATSRFDQRAIKRSKSKKTVVII